MSGDSPWNTSGFATAPNSNVMNSDSMPSDQAQAARERTLEIMDSLKNGKPGEADTMYGPCTLD
jgi:hypothetical protein